VDLVDRMNVVETGTAPAHLEAVVAIHQLLMMSTTTVVARREGIVHVAAAAMTIVDDLPHGTSMTTATDMPVSHHHPVAPAAPLMSTALHELVTLRIPMTLAARLPVVTMTPTFPMATAARMKDVPHPRAEDAHEALEDVLRSSPSTLPVATRDCNLLCISGFSIMRRLAGIFPSQKNLIAATRWILVIKLDCWFLSGLRASGFGFFLHG
jgi:hypothetical protein